MFVEEIKRIKACIEYQDYYSAMEYAILVKDNYKNKEKNCLDNIIKDIKEGNYEKVIKDIKNYKSYK